MEFYDLAGQVALGTRLRRLGEQFGLDAKRVYQLYDIDIDTRWFPVLYTLTYKQSATVTELAESIGQTHPAISQVVREMTKADIVRAKKCPQDGRVSRVSLTSKGLAIGNQLKTQCLDVEQAVKQLLNASGIDLWSAMAAVEDQLSHQSFYQRVKSARKEREVQSVSIEPFRAVYAEAFKALNQHWISQYWDLETSDIKALNDPQGHIIDRGGYIAIAKHQDTVIGCCALIPIDQECVELAKMAVSDEAKGKGVGFLLGTHIIQQAKAMGARRVYLESNTRLEPAINLYKKLGFKRVVGQSSPYSRCNIQMELCLSLDNI